MVPNISPAPNDPKDRRQMIDASNNEELEGIHQHALAMMSTLLSATGPGATVHPDYAIWSNFVGEIKEEQQRRGLKSVKFYFRITLPSGDKSRILDRVVCVQSGSVADAEAYMRGRTDASSFEQIARDQLPGAMEFRPSGITPGVWESTTGFTPLPPRPTDPRDPHAKRNP